MSITPKHIPGENPVFTERPFVGRGDLIDLIYVLSGLVPPLAGCDLTEMQSRRQVTFAFGDQDLTQPGKMNQKASILSSQEAVDG